MQLQLRIDLLNHLQQCLTILRTVCMEDVYKRQTEYYLESCGLTEPRAKITLTDTDGNSFTLVFGNETEGGTLAQFEGSDIVYVVGTDTADYLANATVESLLPAQTDEAA